MFSLGKTEKEFQELYRTQYGGVRRTLTGMTGNPSIAEELTQEAFIKAWKGLPLFAFKSSLKTWLYQVAINVGRDWLRSHKHGREVLQSEEIEERGPQAKAIEESLMELEEDVRTVLLLHYYEGMKQKEIAKILKVPEGTVKSRLHHAKKKLQEELVKKGHDV